MQIDKWQASVRVTVVDGTDPVTMALDVAGSKVELGKMADAVGVAIQKQLEQLAGFAAAEKRELAMLREKVRVLDEANAAAKAKEAEPKPAPRPRGRPRKADQ